MQKVEIIEKSEYLDIYRIDYGVILRVIKCKPIKYCGDFNKRKNKRIAKDCYEITNPGELRCNIGDVILNNCIVGTPLRPIDYRCELKVSGGELLGSPKGMLEYTKRLEEIISKYN